MNPQACAFFAGWIAGVVTVLIVAFVVALHKLDKR